MSALKRWIPLLGGLLLGGLLGAGLTASAAPASAQSGCSPEAEPNNAAEGTTSFTGTACYDGTLPDDDQDLWLWEVTETDADRRWTFSLTGIPATLTSAKLIPITSEPGEVPIRGGVQIVEVNVTPTGSGAASRADLLIPVGRYVLGVSRSATVDQSTPLRLDYRLTIEEGTPLSESGDVEPNDQIDSGTPIRGDQQLSGNLRDSGDHYTWTIPEDTPPGSAFDLDLQFPASYASFLQISRGIAETVVNAYPADDGHVLLPDLTLPPGRYDLSIQPGGSTSVPYELTIRSKAAPDGDPEPNDDVAFAAPINLDAGLIKGVLSSDRDRDHFALEVDEELSQQLFDIRLLWRSGQDRELCLMDDEGTRLQCGYGTEGIALPSLGLEAGRYLLLVDGEADEQPYAIRIDRAGPRPRDFESEPNDSTAFATALDPSILMRGRLAADDHDYFRATVTGSPQLWRIEADGRDLERLELVRADGTTLATGQASEARDEVTINDLFLIPGEHWIEVDGAPGEYTVRMTPLGPPDPNAEREPNNESLEAEALGVAQARLGRLSEQNDVDVYRFSLAATERMRFRAEPPPDGAIEMGLWFDGNQVARVGDAGPGVAVVYDALLIPGDYEVRLEPQVASEGRYQVTAERLDPFTLLDDQEPNDRIAIARPFPASLTLSGHAVNASDEDWYRLEPLATSGPVTIRVAGDVSRVTLHDGTSEITSTFDEEAAAWVTDPAPAGVPLYLMIRTGVDYTVELELPGVDPIPPPEPLAVTMALTLPVTEVAAFWPDGQHLQGTLAISNTGPADLDLALDAVTSQFAWSPELGERSISVAPGGSIEVPVGVSVPADVASDLPVRLTVRARDASGAQATAFAEVAPTQDATAAAPRQAWAVPATMLGGLDVASLALGGAPVGAADPDAEAKLHDGVTPSGTGWFGYPETMPLTLTVDLAGDEPIPVVGTVLNPQSTGAAIHEMPRGFELWLSTDGVEFQQALSGELLPLTVDQAFALETPVPARFAQLRITSVHDDQPLRIVLGEWKVIAQPGSTPLSEPLNIADPIRGGHVVRMDPQGGSQEFADAILTEERRSDWVPVKPGQRSSWVVGFQDDRAAQITQLQWVDPENPNRDMRFRTVDVSYSTESPLGPWQSLGKWQLRHRADGSPDVLALDQPVWARFVRFVGDAPRRDDPGYRELPGTLRVLERATDDGYQSVVGEWGQASRAGPYELLNPPPPLTTEAGADDNDTPETADPFTPDAPASGRVHIDRDVDWYTIAVPEEQNSLTIEVGGTPTVGVSLTLVDPNGIEVPMTFGRGLQPGTVAYRATVSPGQSYLLRVQQPPFSAIVTFDTSGSMSSYYPFVVQGVRAFTADVVRGREGVNLIPFEQDPLLDTFSDEPFVLQDAIDRYVLGEGSSGAEQAILDASSELEGRQGARAILLVTDAESSSYQEHGRMWSELEGVRPVVFSVHVGGDSQPAQTRHTMQDWAVAGGGVYQYARSHAEVDRAFDRLSTWLRRPATYTLSYTTSEEQLPPPDPGSLSVRAAPNDDGSPGEAPVRRDVAIEIVLDTSGSMLKDLGGRRRIDVAKSVLRDLVNERLPAGTPVALRVLGTRAQPCQTQLAVPLGPLDPDAITELVDPITVDQRADTPIGAALRAVADDLVGTTGSRIVLLITDSEEVWPHRDLCGLDPTRSIRELRRQGIDAHLNIVGLAVKNRKARSQMTRWAHLGAGSYFDARNPEQLNRAVATAASAPFQVFDVTGAQVASGTVNGAPIELPPGTYRVVVLTEPEVVFEAVVLDSGGNIALTLPVRTIEEEVPPPEGEGG